MGQKHAFGKKNLKELYANYGDKNLYNSGKFKPLTRNLTTGATLSQSHHCDHCDAKMSISCYENFHYGFCPTWVNRNGKRERCGERFCTRSDGCGKHPRVQGYNDAFYRAADGEDLELSEFDDPDPLNTKGDPDEDDDDMKAEMEPLDELAEQYIEKHGTLPPNFHNNYWAERSRQKAYAEANKLLTPSPEDTVSGVPNGKCKTKGKTVGVKYNKRKGATQQIDHAGRPQNEGAARRGHLTHAGALQPKTTNQGVKDRTFAPKGAKPKKPIEVPRVPTEDQENQIKDTKQGRAKKLAGKVFGKLMGTSE